MFREISTRLLLVIVSVLACRFSSTFVGGNCGGEVLL